MKTKQVIVWRKDLQVRTGKMASQVAHAAMAFLTRNLRVHREYHQPIDYLTNDSYGYHDLEKIEDWLMNSFKKVVVYVNSEEELLEIYKKAEDKGMIAELITDSGATEFHGVPTNTCIAIGPDYEENFEGITDHLPLY